MADISIIKTPDGAEYNIKDTSARADLTSLTSRVSAFEGLQVYTDPNNDGNVVAVLVGVVADGDNVSF